MPSLEKERDGEEKEKKLDKLQDFLQKNIEKGELALKHSLGLGHQPNVVPVTKPNYKGPPRAVEVGWHPVGGVAGKWFAEDTGLGKMITEKINKYPDPTQHWAILVGDYAHQLWMDEGFDVIYTNEKVNREEWRTFEVGETRFNDHAIRTTGESVIQAIREKQPAYNLITNNCQTYALQLLDAIKASGDKEFGTTLAIYERITGPGKITDLFPPADAPPANSQANTVSFAQQVMDENTTQLDAREELDKKQLKKAKKEEKKEEKKREKEEKREKKEEKSKGGFFSRFIKS